MASDNSSHKTKETENVRYIYCRESLLFKITKPVNLQVRVSLEM